MNQTRQERSNPRGISTPAQFILSCLHVVFREPLIHDRWLPAEQLCNYTHMKCNIADEIRFTPASMMRVINKKMLPLTGMEPNIIECADGVVLKVFRHSFQVTKRCYFFWITSKNDVARPPLMPSQGNALKWEEDCVLKRLIAGGRTTHSATSAEQIEPPEPKRLKVSEATTTTTETETVMEEAASMEEATINDTSTNSTTRLSWWESGDARKLFAPSTVAYGANECVKDIVIERIELLESVNRNGKSWTNVVEPGTWNIETCHYSESDVFTLRLRSMYLVTALRQFLRCVTGDIKTQWTWKRCLVSAIQSMNDVGTEYYSNYRTLARWHRKLAKHRLYFSKTPETKTLIPPFFRDNPDAMQAFKKYGVANIQDLRVELMYDYVHHDLIPTLLKKAQQNGLFNDDGDECTAGAPPVAEVGVVTPKINSPKDLFLQSYGLKKLGITTIAKWMHAVGFRYKKREKHYFVDGHERPETLAYRPVFTKKYLDNEIRAHRWIQLTLDESKELESKGLVPLNCGYNFVDDDGISHVEYHIDSSPAFDERLSQLPFGGNLSVRKPIDAKPVIYVGQDEAIFKQFLFLLKMWVGPSGQRPLLPKDEGIGTMVSLFVSREHGIIREISDMILDEVNEQRLGKKYADEEAAIEILGSPEKKPLTKDKSPFLHFFEYGENREGYWNYSNMVIQFEDAVDVLQVMHPTFDFIFLFDHSSGHAKQRPDGLNHHRMNRTFGGKAHQMRDTIIEREDGYLGSFPRILEPGDTQCLVFKESDPGPFWLSDAEREECRHDRRYGSFKDVKLTNAEMTQQLADRGILEGNDTLRNTRQLRSLCSQHGIPTSRSVENVIERNRTELELELRGRGLSIKGKNKRELVDICHNNNIPITKTVEKVREGWEGKAKGLLQVLWERGLIDGANFKQYSLAGKKDEFGILDNSTSLTHLMGLCHDFLNEEGMLQHVAKRIGVEVLLTPKCHAELAGEGVEYVWGGAKGEYRRLSLAQKRGKDNFKSSMHHCLSEEVIPIERVRKYARRARQYLMAYHAVDTGQLDQPTLHDCLKYGPVAIDKLISNFKTHRCVFDFDYNFIMNGDW